MFLSFFQPPSRAFSALEDGRWFYSSTAAGAHLRGFAASALPGTQVLVFQQLLVTI